VMCLLSTSKAIECESWQEARYCLGVVLLMVGWGVAFGYALGYGAGYRFGKPRSMTCK
jgi:ABC-type dipeptide/oligopeptide/nickel transport system permease subunit